MVALLRWGYVLNEGEIDIELASFLVAQVYESERTRPADRAGRYVAPFFLRNQSAGYVSLSPLLPKSGLTRTAPRRGSHKGERGRRDRGGVLVSHRRAGGCHCITAKERRIVRPLCSGRPGSDWARPGLAVTLKLAGPGTRSPVFNADVVVQLVNPDAR
jgi:hypothetical protein